MPRRKLTDDDRERKRLRVEPIRARLKLAREWSGLTQEEVAKFLGIKTGQYEKYENRSALDIVYLADICLILRVPPWFILTGRTRMPPAFSEWYAARAREPEDDPFTL